MKIIKHEQDLVYNFEHLDSPTGWNGFKTEGIKFAIFLFPYAIEGIAFGAVDNYFSKKLHFTLEDEIRSELYLNENALRLAHHNDSSVLIDNLNSDVSIVVNSGSSLATSTISASTRGAYGIGMIVVSSPNIVVYSALYNKATAFVAERLVSQQRVYGEKIKSLGSELLDITKHDNRNIRTISERDGMRFTQDNIERLLGEIRETEGKQNLWGMASNAWGTVTRLADFMLNYCFIAREINRGKIPFDKRNEIQVATWRASNLLSWSRNNAEQMAIIEQSLDRVIILEGIFHAPTNSSDQIQRIIQKGDQLILNNLEVGVSDRVLVTVDELKLNMGKVYAITGESGCGKTSLLSKIKGIKENGIAAKGTIYYPKINDRNPKTVMLSQQDYFPLYSSLQEVLSYPDKISNDQEVNKKQRKEMLMLLKEIGLDNFTSESLNLDSKKDWYTVLSGGEKKKILIISAIIKKPDILILDEIFNGLDQKSIIIAQQILKKYLPNTLMLIVDHHATSNNYNGFYNSELHFENQKIYVQNIE